MARFSIRLSNPMAILTIKDGNKTNERSAMTNHSSSTLVHRLLEVLISLNTAYLSGCSRSGSWGVCFESQLMGAARMRLFFGATGCLRQHSRNISKTWASNYTSFIHIWQPQLL
jgi:hypothetical protein